VPWAVESGSNKLLRVDPDLMSVQEFELPQEKSRPRRLVTTSDDKVWWVDYALGFLGRFDPESDAFSEWPMPGGEDSRPYGVAVDRDDRIWIVESGLKPNRFVGFDTEDEVFFSTTEIPSGAGSVQHMFYYEPAGEIWFGTDTNYIGRARVH
jgi:virginiamycin B lyase